MKIGMIGSGNVAWHLSHRLFEAGNPPLFVWSRNHESAYRLASQVLSVTLPDLSSIHRDIDLLIMAVHDDAIGEIAPEVTLPSNVIAAHTSGTASMQVLAGHFEHFGVFYPLQTLTAGIPVPHGEFPLIVDGESDKTIEFLRKTAWSISPSVTHLPEVERQALHLAAVFTNNFTNAILAITYKICEKSGLDFNLVLPLLRETIRKVHLTDPDSAQTGPAKRRDIRTIRSQLAQLKDEPGWQELYKQLSLIINPGLDLIQTNTEPEKDPDAPH